MCDTSHLYHLNMYLFLFGLCTLQLLLTQLQLVFQFLTPLLLFNTVLDCRINSLNVIMAITLVRCHKYWSKQHVCT